MKMFEKVSLVTMKYFNFRTTHKEGIRKNGAKQTGRNRAAYTKRAIANEFGEFPCDKCARIFDKRQKMVAHRYYEHPKNGIKKKQVKKEQIFSCERCEKTYLTNKNLKEHVLKFHEKITPYSCEQCHRSFGLESTLKTHIANMHQKVPCDKCNQICSTSMMLKRHKAKVHGIISDKAHQCEFCSLVYEQKPSLERHIAKYHSKIEPILH